MRPTNLSFRSPAEKSGEFVLPIVTCNGNYLWNGEVKEKKTFSVAKRFSQYEIDAKRTESIGPGSYNLRSPVEEIEKSGLRYAELAKKKFYINNYRTYDLDELLKTYHFPSSPNAVETKKMNKKHEKKRKKPSVLPYLQSDF